MLTVSPLFAVVFGEQFPVHISQQQGGFIIKKTFCPDNLSKFIPCFLYRFLMD